MVNFSCPKNIPEKELDIIQTFESKILKEKNQEDLRGNSNKSEDKPPKEDPAERSSWRLPGKEPAEESGFEQVEEEGARVSRMIKFVQEPGLTGVAGEWVLARFSGMPGTNWFLCYLELGSSRHDFYGHRIATDEIDFHNAFPEMGLIKYWEYYSEHIRKLMESKDRGKLKTEIGQSIAKRVAKEAGISSRGDCEEDSEVMITTGIYLAP
ncbi:hypothetical protein AAE478_005645 [Parahypoxylon ruwenzoriense]